VPHASFQIALLNGRHGTIDQYPFNLVGPKDNAQFFDLLSLLLTCRLPLGKLHNVGPYNPQVRQSRSQCHRFME
jgi:hypothetical protein